MRNPRNESVALLNCLSDRHPGLEPGPKAPRALPSEDERRQPDRRAKIVPVRVATLDQHDLPIPQPSFDPLLGGDGVAHRFGGFEPYESRYAIFGGEAVKRTFAMLDNPRWKVRRHSRVQRAVEAASHDVDARLPVPHASASVAPWAPAQGRGDVSRWGASA